MSLNRYSFNQKSNSVFSAAAIFLASVHGKCFAIYWSEDVVVFTKNNSPLSTLKRGQLIRVLCVSWTLYKYYFYYNIITNIAKLRSWTSGGVSILCRYRVFSWLRDRGHVEKAEQWNHVSSWDLFLYLCKNIPWFQQRHCHMVMQSIYKQVKNSLFSIILVYAWFTSVVFTIMLELLNRK